MARHFLAFISEDLRVRILVFQGTFRAVNLRQRFRTVSLFPLHFELEASVFQVFRQVELFGRSSIRQQGSLATARDLEKIGGFQPV
jgi:hypothetical protein